MGLGQIRAAVVEAPIWLFYRLMSWIYPTKILRNKASTCLYDRTRLLLLRRSGITIGADVTVQYGVAIVGIGRTPPAVTLGDRCAVGPYTVFITSSYPDSSNLLRNADVKRMIKRFSPIRVGEDAWIGAGVIIFPGVSIGAGAIIGAGTVVRHNVPSYAVVAGCPDRILHQLTPPTSEAICD